MTAAKRPDVVTVMGMPYRVEERTRDETASGAMGATHHRSLVLAIATEQAPCQERDTMLHEIVHSILHLADLNEKKVDERFVNVFSTVFLDTMRRNPGLIPYLMSSDE